MSDLVASGVLALAFGVLFGTAELLHRVFRFRAEVTRKIVHVGTGLLTMLFPLLLSDQLWVLALCAGFFVILLLSLRFGFLPSINAVDRTTYGSLVYPGIVYLTFLFFTSLSAWQGHRDLLWFYLPVLVMALCDPLAALVGKTVPIKSVAFWGSRKSLGGTGAFLLGAFALSWAAFALDPSFSRSWGTQAAQAGEVAVLAAVAETLGAKGWDNLTIPLAVAAVLAGNLLAAS